MWTTDRLLLRLDLVRAWISYQASKFYFHFHRGNHWVGTGLGFWVHFRNPSLRASGLHLQIGLGNIFIACGINLSFDVAGTSVSHAVTKAKKATRNDNRRPGGRIR